jgi:hypothetical protein
MNEKESKKLKFAICISNEDYKTSLEIGKLYRVIPDQKSLIHGYLRIIDESGEDYGYSADRFFLIELPETVEKALVKAL